MNEFDYRPNSHRSKEEQTSEEKKRVEKVVKGAVKTKKKNGISKLGDVFISEDAKNVKSYIFMDVLIPAAKKAISDIVTDGIDMILYGGKGRKSTGTSKVSYRNYYDRRDDDRFSRPSSGRFDYDDISFEYRADAEAVRDQLIEMIDRYRVATVADLYDAAGRSAPYTSNRYGWTNLSSAEVYRTRDSDYIIKLPRAVPID